MLPSLLEFYICDTICSLYDQLYRTEADLFKQYYTSIMLRIGWKQHGTKESFEEFIYQNPRHQIAFLIIYQRYFTR